MAVESDVESYLSSEFLIFLSFLSPAASFNRSLLFYYDVEIWFNNHSPRSLERYQYQLIDDYPIGSLLKETN